VAAPLSITMPIVAAEAHGVTITDVDGNVFVDFTGGVGCLNVGHTPARVVAAATEQLERFTHTDFTVVPYESYVALAERLVGLVPISGPVRAAFFNSGAEAIENAVKIARSYTRRPAVIAFDGGFHGRTLMAMSLTSKTHPYKAGLGPFAPEVYRVPFPNAYRGPDALAALAELERALSLRVAAEEVAAIVFEPVQGEGGFVVAPEEFVRGLRRICDEHGIVLVADEVQTGFGRTGRWWGIEQYGVQPDMMTMAKGVANGLPLGVTICTPAVADSLKTLTLSTFGGNPISATAANATIDFIEKEHLAANASEQGAMLRAGLEELKARHPKTIGDVRGMGLMQAIELVTDETVKDRTPNPKAVLRLFEETKKRGLLIGKGGLYGNVIRISPPLTIREEEVDEALGILGESLAAMEAR
jgi:4-aminobutyrate aminotransferase / (S)-3-amino-2-methylpropionate transaminase / 5-aminovalerate transaminase